MRRSQKGIPYYQLLYGDIVKEHEATNIDWCRLSCKMMYAQINKFHLRKWGVTQNEGLNEEESERFLQQNLSYERQDRAFTV